MTRYLSIDKNNILKSISDKLYVYKFDPNESGISTDFNTKLTTIGTKTIKYYSDLPISMTYRCDRTLIRLVGTYELKPRIDINSVYYYTKPENVNLEPNQNSVYCDKSGKGNYIYNNASDKILELVEGRLLFTKFNSLVYGEITPSDSEVYYDRSLETYYRYTGEYLEPLDEEPIGIVIDKGYCIDPHFFVNNSEIDSSDRYLYHDLGSGNYYIYKGSKFEKVIPIKESDVDGSKRQVYYSSDLGYCLHTPSNFEQVTILQGEYDSGWIHSTLSSNPDPESSIMYYDDSLDSYFRYMEKGYDEVKVINCYINEGIAYIDEELTQRLEVKEDIPYFNLLDDTYYRWKSYSTSQVKCYDGYRDGDKFYDKLNSIYVPEPDALYHDISNERYYIYNGTRYTQRNVIQGYYVNERFYSDSTLITEIELVEDQIYHDKISDFYFTYTSYEWTNLSLIEGYLSNGNFYLNNGSYVPPSYSNLYKYDEVFYLYLNGRYVKVDRVNCFYTDGSIFKSISGNDFLYSCIISEDCASPEYKIMETGEYIIVPPNTKIDDYINAVNDGSQYLYLEKSDRDINELQVANIFGVDIKDTVLVHRFNDTSPYGSDCRVLLDEKMQVAQWVNTLKDRYPSIVFYTDPNDRGKISTHTNEFVYYQAKLFSDDSQYTTPLRYGDYRYGKVRSYDIPIFVRYECPDMVTFLNRRNEFLMHEFLCPVTDLNMNLDNGDLVHIGVSWSRAIREEEPDKNVDASERNVYMFLTQCNLNGLLLERTDTPTPIDEVIANIYSTSEIK